MDEFANLLILLAAACKNLYTFTKTIKMKDILQQNVWKVLQVLNTL